MGLSISLYLDFADYEQAYAKKKSRRQIFLEKTEATLQWDSLLTLVHHV